jgi:hypothetical protein
MTSNPASAIPPASPMTTMHSVVRHLAATLAYRASKVLRDVPPQFHEFSVGEGRRTPVRILAHLGDLMAWGVRIADGEPKWQAAGSADWDRELRRFFGELATLDARLSLGSGDARALELLIQGPLADALTHVGQLAMLRGIFGAPVRPESYARASIAVGQVGFEQPPAGREFDGDASATG